MSTISSGPGLSTAPRPDRPPVYPTPPSDTPEFRAARGGWIAEQHFVYEVSNDADTILLSMATGERLVTVVLQPDNASGTEFRMALCRTVDEQKAYYRASRSRRHIAAAEVFGTIGSEWYGFVEGLLTHRVLETGQLTTTLMCGLLPVSAVEDVIIGEIGFGVAVVERTAQQSIEARRRARRIHDERAHALQSGDLKQLAALYDAEASVVERAYPSGAQVVLSGREAIVAFYAERLNRWSNPRVEPIVAIGEEWYGFEELLWAGNRDGTPEQFRTAAVFQPSDAGDRIVHQIGFGTALSTS
jgi:hypothetical protein